MTDMENEVRDLLADISNDIPPQRQVPPPLRGRARRRIAAVGATMLAVTAVLVTGSVVVVRSLSQPPGPIQPSPTLTDPSGTVHLPTDPEAWQRIVLPGGPPGCAGPTAPHGCLVRSIAAGDAGVVAMGSRFTCCGEEFVGWSSPNGLSWHQIESDNTSQAEGLAAAGPGFVAVRGESIFTSTDGVSWDRVQSNPHVEYLGVAAGGPGVVAVGGPNKAWFSSDGLTWEAATVPPVPADIAPGDDRKPPQISMTKVAAGADRLVATGRKRLDHNPEELAIWVSSDGMSWRDVPIDGDIFSPSSGRERDCRITNIAGRPDGFVAAGWCGPGGGEESFVWRSDDGVHWERLGGDAFDGKSPPYLAVAASPGGWVAVDGAAMWTSVDGESWTRVPTGSTFQGAQPIGVTVWGSRFVVAGSTDDDQNVVWISGPQGQESSK